MQTLREISHTQKKKGDEMTSLIHRKPEQCRHKKKMDKRGGGGIANTLPSSICEK